MDKLTLKLLLGSLRSGSGINGYCQNLLVGPLQRVDGVGVWIARLNSSAELQIEGESNVLGLKLIGLRVPLLRETPISIAVRTRQFHSANKLPDEWVSGTKLPTGLNFSAFPIQQDLLVRGAMMVGHAGRKEAKEFIFDFHDLLEAMTGLCFELGKHDLKRINGDSLSIREELSARQLKVLAGIQEGLTNYQIARAMNVSESTVKQESIRIYRFLDVNSRHDAIEVALELGLLQPHPEEVTNHMKTSSGLEQVAGS